MRIGLISDIHGNVCGLEAALAALSGHRVDRIICLGDIVGYYPFVNETIDRLVSDQITCIAGNHDAALTGSLEVDPGQWSRYALDHANSVITSANLDWLRALPDRLDLEVEGRRLILVHGSPWAPLTEYVYPDHEGFGRFEPLGADIVAMGHTHWPMVRRIGTTVLVNPGSCGQPRDYVPGACYGLLDTSDLTVSLHRVGYEIDRVAREVRSVGLDESFIDILYREKVTP